MTASSVGAESWRWFVRPACAPAAGSPGGAKILSFSRRRHIDLQRVTSCLCPPVN